MGKAFIILDMLNEYVDPEGKKTVEGAPELIPNILMLRDTFEDQNVPIYYANNVIGENDTWASEIFPSLKPHYVDHVISKNQKSAFSNKNFEAELKENHIQGVYISGVVTESSVYETAIDAIEKGFEVEIIDDAIAGKERNSFAERKALKSLEDIGAKIVCTMKVLDDHVLLTAI